MTYRLGFRDEFEPEVSEIVRLICALEIHTDPKNARRVVQEIEDSARHSSHIIPHYDVVGKAVRAGWATPIYMAVRSFLIENIYDRLSTMFPETANWTLDNEEILRVGVKALI